MRRLQTAKNHSFAAWALALAGVAASCAEAPFSPHRPDNVKSDLDKVTARLTPVPARPVNAAGAPLVAIVSPGPDVTLSVYDLASGKARFTVKANIRSRALITRDTVVAREGERRIVGRSLSSGAVVWDREIEGGATFMGAATDGDGVYYVTEQAGPRKAESEVSTIVGLDADDGGQRFTLSATSRLGTPAARNSLVFVPFGYQWVTVLDARNGEELARIRNKEEAINFVTALPEGIYFGSRGVYRLDEKSAVGTRKGSTYFQVDVPDDYLRIVYAYDSFNAAQSGYTAYDRNRLLWLPGRGGVGFAPGVVLHSYRFFFGIDPAGGRLLWAYSFPRVDVVASAHTGSHIVLVSAEGDVVALNPTTGAEVWRSKLPARAAGASLDVRGFAPRGAEQPAMALRDALLSIIWDPDRRFEAVKLFALGQLARAKDAKVTEDLIKVVTFEKIDKKVYERSGEALLARVRPEDLPLLLKALTVRTNFLEGTRARGVDMLARAAGKIGASDAVEPLLGHFRDHETTPVAVREIARALDAIGSKTALGPFREFLLTYRADPDLAAEPDVMRRVCDALLRIGIKHDRQLIRFVAEDPQTQPYLRKYAADSLKGKPAPKPGEKPKAPAKAAPGKADATTTPTPTPVADSRAPAAPTTTRPR